MARKRGYSPVSREACSSSKAARAEPGQANQCRTDEPEPSGS